jgi:large subunit ribosomal protein L31e
MAKIERTYNIPLRKGFYKAPRYKKAKKAITTLKAFLIRHMKCEPEQLKIGKRLNEEVWGKGIKNPPHHVKVLVIKDEKGIVKAELFGMKYEEPIKPEMKEEKAEKKPASEKKAGEKAEKEVEDLPAEIEEVVKKEVTSEEAYKKPKKAPAKKKAGSSSSPKAEKKAPAKKKSEKVEE